MSKGICHLKYHRGSGHKLLTKKSQDVACFNSTKFGGISPCTNSIIWADSYLYSWSKKSLGGKKKESRGEEKQRTRAKSPVIPEKREINPLRIGES